MKALQKIQQLQPLEQSNDPCYIGRLVELPSAWRRPDPNQEPRRSVVYSQGVDNTLWVMAGLLYNTELFLWAKAGVE